MDPAAYREMAETEDRHWWFCGRRAIADQVIRSVGGGRKLKILEIGAGTGGNLGMLANYGDVTAVEMDENARKIAKQKTGKDVLPGYLPSGLPDIGNEYDLVCMFDVLEHVEDDVAALNRVYELLKPGGFFVLTVPAYQWMWSVHDEYLHHFRRYSKGEINKKLHNARLGPKRISYTNMTLFPLAVMARYYDKWFRKNEHSYSTGSDMPPRHINQMLKNISLMEVKIVRKWNVPFGLGLIAICRK